MATGLNINHYFSMRGTTRRERVDPFLRVSAMKEEDSRRIGAKECRKVPNLHTTDTTG